MGKAPESSDLPAAAPNQHGDAATLDVFAELERAGVPAKKRSASSKNTPDAKQDNKKDDAREAAKDVAPAASEPQVSAPREAQDPATALLFQPPARPTRRASAPAGPPPSSRDRNEQADDASDERSESSRPEQRRSNRPTDSDAEESTNGSANEVASESDEEGGQRRRRRRGGRGRRGRGTGGGEAEAGSSPGGDQSDDQDSAGQDTESTEKTAGSAGDKPAAKSGSKPRGKSDANAKPETKSDAKSDSRGGSDKSDADNSQRPDAGESDADTDETAESSSSDDGDSNGSSSRRRRRRRRGGSSSRPEEPRSDEVATPRGSTRLEAKRQRRREGRETGRRKPIITEAEFLARRESVNRTMMVRERDGRMQIAVLEDDVLVEHYVSRNENASIAGNVYVGKVQNVLPSMEAAFVDIGKGRNAVLYAGEVNWDAAGLEGGEPRRIESALSSGDHVLVQVTKDPIGHKGARLTAQVSLAGRFLVYVPNGSMTGISRKLPDTERARLKKILKDIVPEGGGVIVRTAAEGASEDELRADIERLQKRWHDIEAAQKNVKKSAGPKLVHSEADMAIRVVRDIFNEDFEKLVVSGDQAWAEISNYIEQVAPDLTSKLSQWESKEDIFAAHRIDEQLAKAMDRKVYLPSGGSLVIDRTEAMTVVDVNTGRFTGTGGTLEETVTKNNLEAAEEVVRQLRLRDIGGIIVIDFIDMVLEQNRDLVMRRLVECLGRDRTKHQVAEVTSLGLVQMTRKRVGQGLVEAFSEKCDHCGGRGFITHDEPVEKDSSESEPKSEKSSRSSKQEDRGSGGNGSGGGDNSGRRNTRRRRKETSDSDSSGQGGASAKGNGRGSGKAANEADKAPASKGNSEKTESDDAVPAETPEEVRAALAAIAAAAVQSHERKTDNGADEANAGSNAESASEPDAEPASEPESGSDSAPETASDSASAAPDAVAEKE